MWKALIKLVEKWACCHKWEEYQASKTYGNSLIPSKIEYTLICQKCGKIKKIEI